MLVQLYSLVIAMARLIFSHYLDKESCMLLCTRNDRADLLTLHCEIVQVMLPIPISHTAWLVLKRHGGFISCPALGLGTGWGGS